MRILLSADPFIEVPPKLYGGTERVIDSLVRHLRARGHQICLVAKTGSECAADSFYAWPGIDSPMNFWTLWKAVRTFKPDIIHSFSRLAYLAPHLRGPVPIVMTYEREATPRTVRMAVTLAAPKVIRFTGCSNDLASRGRRGGGDWRGIHNMFEIDTLKFSPTVAPDAPLCFLSRVESIKGADWSIEIARRTGNRLVIAGNHSDSGPEGDYWRQKIEPWIGRDGIEYIGAVDDAQKNKVLGEARAMVVPIQWNEPFGIVFAEALACGTPVISCPRGSLPEIVRPGIEGFLIKSIEEGCEAVAKLDTIDRAACRRRAEQEFAPEVIVSRYFELYQLAIAEFAQR